MPQIGDYVTVFYVRPEYGQMPTQVSGTLGVETDDAGCITALMIEGDGSVTRVPRDQVWSVES